MITFAQSEAGIKDSLKTLHRFGYSREAAVAIANRFGTLPTLILVTSRRFLTSMTVTSSESVSLTHRYFPSGEKASQFGPPPVGTFPTNFRALTS
jgi:hypothetical protein